MNEELDGYNAAGLPVTLAGEGCVCGQRCVCEPTCVRLRCANRTYAVCGVQEPKGIAPAVSTGVRSVQCAGAYCTLRRYAVAQQS